MIATDIVGPIHSQKMKIGIAPNAALQQCIARARVCQVASYGILAMCMYVLT